MSLVERTPEISQREDASWSRDGSSGPLIAVLVVTAVISLLLPGYQSYLAITAVIVATVLLGLGVVTGSAGMISLCQMSFAAVGAWIVTFLNEHSAPGGFLVWLVTGAVVAGVVGLIVGVPALRLRGVNLAVVTLGFAAAVDATLTNRQFPGAVSGGFLARPDWLVSDRAYLAFCLAIFALVALVLVRVQASSVGDGWRAVAFSERGAAATGSSVTTLKLLAFAVSAAVAGLGGGLLVGQVGSAYPATFSTVQSLSLYLLAIIVGSRYADMALVGGLMFVLFPELLQQLGISQDWGLVLFGVMGVQALTTNSTLGDTIRESIRARRAASAPDGTRTSDLADRPQIEAGDSTSPRGPVRPDESRSGLSVRGLTVRYDAVLALDNVDLDVPPGQVVGLIGPNGAGKSTLVDAVTGYLPTGTGTVDLGARRLDGLPPHRRARAGLRRTFQQDRVPPTVTIGDCVALTARGASTREEIADALRWFGCPHPGTPAGTLDSANRRLVEVVAQVCARPDVLVLDEPAAGLSLHEHQELGRRLSEVPERFGCAVLLIEHDLDLVRSVCHSVTVLEFGQVIAVGDPATVLRDPVVREAYLGEVAHS